MKTVTLEQILQIHTILVEQTGGSRGLRDLGRLESVIASQTQSVFGQDLYEGKLEKAAALIRGVISDHPFVDGNKRTAMLVGLTFLKINDIKLSMPKGSIEDFAVRIAVDRLDIKDITKWLEQHTH
jgi:death-on-curing protein